VNDDGRRVIQCRCLAWSPWRDLRSAWALGWQRQWTPGPAGLVAEWQCPDCYVPPAPPPPPASGVPAYLVALVRSDVEVALEQLELLRQADEARWRAVVDELLEVAGPGARRRLVAHAKRRQAATRGRGGRS
jgi:hypothetical protein